MSALSGLVTLTLSKVDRLPEHLGPIPTFPFPLKSLSLQYSDRYWAPPTSLISALFKASSQTLTSLSISRSDLNNTETDLYTSLTPSLPSPRRSPISTSTALSNRRGSRTGRWHSFGFRAWRKYGVLQAGVFFQSGSPNGRNASGRWSADREASTTPLLKDKYGQDKG